jgi:hypothetical protein
MVLMELAVVAGAAQGLLEIHKGVVPELAVVV